MSNNMKEHIQVNEEEIETQEEREEREAAEEREELAYIRSLVTKVALFDLPMRQPSNTSKKSQTISTKKTNKLSLEEFSKKIEEEIKTIQPKKFMSQRADIKRKELGLDKPVEVRRSFNPKKLPYNFVFRQNDTNKEINITNTTDFPSL